MQASLCFFLAIIVLVQIGNAYPKNKGASLAEEADGSKKTAVLNNIVKRAAKHLAQRMAAPQSLPCEAGCVPPVDPPPFNGVSSELSLSRRMRKPGPVQKNEAKTDVIRQKEAQIGSLMRQKQTV